MHVAVVDRCLAMEWQGPGAACMPGHRGFRRRVCQLILTSLYIIARTKRKKKKKKKKGPLWRAKRRIRNILTGSKHTPPVQRR
jgi:hypothetical protein